jgi:hypothetical protein
VDLKVAKEGVAAVAAELGVVAGTADEMYLTTL